MSLRPGRLATGCCLPMQPVASLTEGECSMKEPAWAPQHWGLRCPCFSGNCAVRPDMLNSSPEGLRGRRPCFSAHHAAVGLKSPGPVSNRVGATERSELSTQGRLRIRSWVRIDGTGLRVDGTGLRVDGIGLRVSVHPVWHAGIRRELPVRPVGWFPVGVFALVVPSSG
jgi:hypothetical protein